MTNRFPHFKGKQAIVGLMTLTMVYAWSKDPTVAIIAAIFAAGAISPKIATRRHRNQKRLN